MNDRSTHLHDPGTHAAPVSAAGPDSLEPPLSAATAALWRRRFRAHEALVSFPQDENRVSESPVSSGSAGVSPPDVRASDLGESQRTGLTAATSVTAPPSGPSSAWSSPGLRPGPPPARSPVALTAERLPVTPPRQSEAQGSNRNGPRFAHAPGLLLIAVLTLQAVLSLRLVWSNTAFLDEATYLYGGHVEIAHWIHGTPLPPLATYFSGAPVIYPPLAALAASIGGLAAARMLSLAFMLGATALLWSTTSKLFGKRAAFFAAALFAVLGPTEALGAFATYDAMALLLLAASAWCVVSAQDRDDSTLFLLAGIYHPWPTDAAIPWPAVVRNGAQKGREVTTTRPFLLKPLTAQRRRDVQAASGPVWLEDVCVPWGWVCLTPMWTTDVDSIDYWVGRYRDARRNGVLAALPRLELSGLDKADLRRAETYRYRPSLFRLAVVSPVRHVARASASGIAPAPGRTRLAMKALSAMSRRAASLAAISCRTLPSDEPPDTLRGTDRPSGSPAQRAKL